MLNEKYWMHKSNMSILNEKNFECIKVIWVRCKNNEILNNRSNVFNSIKN